MATATTPASVATGLAVAATGVVRRFGHSRALNGLDLEIPWEQRVAILGANGAGKSTLLRVLATLLRPTAGSVVIGGLALPEQAAAVRCHVGLVAHQTFLYDELTVRENLLFYARLYGVTHPTERADALIERVGLADRADSRVRSLSRGLQQRAALARAIVHDPAILLLDEPDTGLDVRGDALLQAMMSEESGRSRTVLLTTHNLDRALSLADRVVVLTNGRVADDRPARHASVAGLAATIRGEWVGE